MSFVANDQIVLQPHGRRTLRGIESLDLNERHQRLDGGTLKIKKLQINLGTLNQTRWAKLKPPAPSASKTFL